MLTDGADTRFTVNRTFNPQQMTIPEFLKTDFNRFGARINLVFFTAALEKPEELARARADFEVPLKSLDPPGTFVTADNRQELIGTLEKAIDPAPVYELWRPDGRPIDGGLLPLTMPGEEDQVVERSAATRSLQAPDPRGPDLRVARST